MPERTTAARAASSAAVVLERCKVPVRYRTMKRRCGACAVGAGFASTTRTLTPAAVARMPTKERETAAASAHALRQLVRRMLMRTPKKIGAGPWPQRERDYQPKPTPAPAEASSSLNAPPKVTVIFSPIARW